MCVSCVCIQIITNPNGCIIQCECCPITKRNCVIVEMLHIPTLKYDKTLTNTTFNCKRYHFNFIYFHPFHSIYTQNYTMNHEHIKSRWGSPEVMSGLANPHRGEGFARYGVSVFSLGTVMY